jgi:hypothetical protein
MVGASLDRVAQPLHREFDISRLQIAPAFNLGLISILRVSFEIFLGELPRVRLLAGELLADVQEKRPNSLPWMLISNSKRSSFENRTEWAESRGLERNGYSENNGGDATGWGSRAQIRKWPRLLGLIANDFARRTHGLG